MNKSDLPELREIVDRLTKANESLDLLGAGSASEFPEVQRLMDKADDLFDVDRLESHRLNAEAAELWLKKIMGETN